MLTVVVGVGYGAGYMEILTYNPQELRSMSGEQEFNGAVVFYRVEDANMFLRFVRALRDQGINAGAKVEQIQVRFEGDGEKHVYRVDFGLFPSVTRKPLVVKDESGNAPEALPA